jgi:hypothetical protein
MEAWEKTGYGRRIEAAGSARRMGRQLCWRRRDPYRPKGKRGLRTLPVPPLRPRPRRCRLTYGVCLLTSAAPPKSVTPTRPARPIPRKMR